MSTYGIWGGILAVEKSLTEFTTVEVKLKSVVRIVFEVSDVLVVGGNILFLKPTCLGIRFETNVML